MERTLVLIFHNGKIKYGYSDDWEEFLDENTAFGDRWGLYKMETPIDEAVLDFTEYVNSLGFDAETVQAI